VGALRFALSAEYSLMVALYVGPGHCPFFLETPRVSLSGSVDPSGAAGVRR